MILKTMKTETKTTTVQREAIFKEIEKQYIDASKLSADTGWKPLMSIEEGLKKTVEWYTYTKLGL